MIYSSWMSCVKIGLMNCCNTMQFQIGMLLVCCHCQFLNSFNLIWTCLGCWTVNMTNPFVIDNYRRKVGKIWVRVRSASRYNMWRAPGVLDSKACVPGWITIYLWTYPHSFHHALTSMYLGAQPSLSGICLLLQWWELQSISLWTATIGKIVRCSLRIAGPV